MKARSLLVDKAWSAPPSPEHSCGVGLPVPLLPVAPRLLPHVGPSRVLWGPLCWVHGHPCRPRWGRGQVLKGGLLGTGWGACAAGSSLAGPPSARTSCQDGSSSLGCRPKPPWSLAPSAAQAVCGGRLGVGRLGSHPPAALGLRTGRDVGQLLGLRWRLWAVGAPPRGLGCRPLHPPCYFPYLCDISFYF